MDKNNEEKKVGLYTCLQRVHLSGDIRNTFQKKTNANGISPARVPHDSINVAHRTVFTCSLKNYTDRGIKSTGKKAPKLLRNPFAPALDKLVKQQRDIVKDEPADIEAEELGGMALAYLQPDAYFYWNFLRQCMLIEDGQTI